MESAENQAQPQSDNESKVANNSSLSKTETIALLNESIDRLEETISKISQDSSNVPSSKSLDNLVSSTQELEAAVTLTEAKVSTPVAATPVPPPTAIPSTVTKSATTNSVAKQKPQSQKNSKKNIGLIAIAVAAIAIAVVTVFWLWKPQQFASLLPQTESPAQPAGIVVAPPKDIATQPLEAETTPTEDDIEVIDSPADNLGIVSDISAMDFPPEIESVAKPIEDVVETVIPEELTAPSRAKNLKMVAIKPKLDFTPEQNLVAVLDTKISELVETYPQELIQSVSLDLPASRLLVRVTDDWYDLDESGKDSLGNEILERARDFRFQNLELRDSSETLVARNPIIGENIIVLPNSEK